MSSSNMRIKYSSSTTRTRGAAADELVIAVSRPSTQDEPQSSSLAQLLGNMLIMPAKGLKRVENAAQSPAGRRSHGIPADLAPAGHCGPGGAACDGRSPARAICRSVLRGE